MLAAFGPDDPVIDAWLDACAPSIDLVASAISATLDPELIVLDGRFPQKLAAKDHECVRFIAAAAIVLYLEASTDLPLLRPAGFSVARPYAVTW